MKRIITKFFAVMLTVAVSTACGSVADTVTERWTVAPHRADCVGVAPMRCLVINRAGSPDWEYIYSGIEGFHYEEGYTYEIEVKVERQYDVPADGSSLKYVLVRQISKKAI